MRKEEIRYTADGLDMIGYLFVPDAVAAGPLPGVAVYPDARGLGAHAIGRAERLAQQGYVTMACDLYGEALFLEDLPKIFERLGPLHADKSRLRARAKGGLDIFRQRSEVDLSRVAAIGYCLGGLMSLELARNGEDLVGIVGFHARLPYTDKDEAKRIKGKVLMCQGGDDPRVPLDERVAFEDEMRSAGVDWQMNLYGGVLHGFTMEGIENFGDPKENHYHPQADARSAADMQRFLDEVFV